MTKRDDSNATFEYVGFGFTLEEATKLMHQEVIKKSNKSKAHTLQNTGLVSGVLHINEEIELVIQFYGGIEQFNKQEFESSLLVITND